MTQALPAIQALTALGSLASGVGSIFGAVRGQPKAPTVTPRAPAVPSGPATQPDITQFGAVSPAQAPEGLQLGGGGVTPIQRLTQLATFGVHGSPLYRSQSAQDYFQNLAMQQYVDPSTGRATGEVAPIARSYARNVIGVEPRTGTTASFLSALLRG